LPQRALCEDGPHLHYEGKVGAPKREKGGKRGKGNLLLGAPSRSGLKNLRQQEESKTNRNIKLTLQMVDLLRGEKKSRFSPEENPTLEKTGEIKNAKRAKEAEVLKTKGG